MIRIINLGVAGLRKVAVLLLVLFCMAPAMAQVNLDAYRDYFLVGQFGEVCTMCEVTVLCERAAQPPADIEIPGYGTFTVYHIQTRTFWSQVSTIWEWFIANFSADSLASRGHTRPVHVYKVTDGEWAPGEVIEGRMVLEPGVLEFGDYNIDRVTQAWQQADTGAAVGFCTRLPLWDALEVIEEQTNGDAT